MKALACSTYEEDHALFAGFATDTGGEEYVLFSITLDPDKQDRDLGLDGLHIEINGQGQGGYEKVARIVSTPSGLTVYPKAQGDPLRIDLERDITEAEQTVAALRSICHRAGVAFEDTTA